MEAKGEIEEQNKTVSVRTYCCMGDRLSHAHKSGPMPKVKEALPLVTAGAGAAILLCIQWLLVAAPTPAPIPSPKPRKKRITHPLWCFFLVLYIVAANISLTFF